MTGKKKAWRGVANPKMAAAMRARRSSSAASPHVLLPRKGTRQQRREQAIRDFEDRG